MCYRSKTTSTLFNDQDMYVYESRNCAKLALLSSPVVMGKPAVSHECNSRSLQKHPQTIFNNLRCTIT